MAVFEETLTAVEFSVPFLIRLVNCSSRKTQAVFIEIIFAKRTDQLGPLRWKEFILMFLVVFVLTDVVVEFLMPTSGRVRLVASDNQ
jgi:hypothetical protein